MARRLLFSYLVLISVTVILLAGIVYLETGRTFSRYVNDQTNSHSEMLPVMFNGYYAVNNTWDGIQEDVEDASTLINLPITLTNSQEKIVAATQLDLIGQAVSEAFDLGQAFPIEDGKGTLIGTVFVGRTLAQQRADEAFLASVTRSQLLGGLFVALIAVGIGALLSRSFSRPITEMNRAVAKISQGDYSARVLLQGKDEIADLALAFNQMAESIKSLELLRRDLVSNISHDLRTPLTVIRGYLEGLHSGQIADRRSAEMAFEVMHSEVVILLRLVDNLNQVAAAEAGALPLDCHLIEASTVIENVIARIRPLADMKRITLNKSAAPELPSINLDAERIEQALFNLLENGIRHTPAGGTITVNANQVENNLEFIVHDTGEGIPSEHIQHIFERFYRVDPARNQNEGGAGLGLAIVSANVTAHGGRMFVKSSGVSGKGSTFTIQLPLKNL
jgi:two-component system, OmpR family, sensor histidine kinase BaeS